MKRLLLLTGILVALVVIAWSAGMFGGTVSTMDLPVLEVDADRVSRIDVRNGDEYVQARRLDSGEWQLTAPVQAKADTVIVMRLLRQVDDFRLESIVSSNPERFGRFQVDSSGSELTLEWGERRLDLIVGKTGPDFQSRYVRLDGDTRVMLANGVPNLSTQLDQWRDKTLWSMPAEAVTSISVTNEEETYGLVRSNGGWRLNSSANELAVDSTEVAAFLSRLSALKADGFLPGLTVDSVLADVTHELRAEFAGGTTETLLMSERENDVAAVRSGGDDVFKFFSYRLANLTPPLDKLVPSGEAATEPR